MTTLQRSDRQQVIQWAQQILGSNACILDTETTGFDGKAQVIEIGLIDCSGAVLMQQLVRPTVPVHPAATEVHHYTEADLLPHPTFDEVLPALQYACDRRPVIIYNAKFDLRVIRQSPIAE